jgi:trans-2-enoyl-CoA reductase
VERPDSVNYANARGNLSGNAFWRDKLLGTYVPKRTDLARQQLDQPFMMKMEDYELRMRLQQVVKEILEKMNEA